MPQHLRDLVITFLYKYFFILKAAAEGWRIAYCGGNKFIFCQNVTNVSAQISDTNLDFIARYSLINKLP